MKPVVVKSWSILPGFGLTMGFSLSYLSLIVLIPLATLFYKAAGLAPSEMWGIVTSERVLAAFRLSILGALVAASLNAVFGLILAWALVRYEFPGKRILDGLVDLPFALPTAVAGIALTAILSSNGWVGRLLEPMGIKAAYTPIGVVIAMTLMGLPFVVRTVQPVLEDVDAELEEAASSLGATRPQTIVRVIFPALMPAMLTGFALAFAKAVGEYGSVVFISGNMPMKTEIVPLLIMTRLEEFDYKGAAALAGAMLLLSFSILLLINLLQAWSRRWAGK